VDGEAVASGSRGGSGEGSGDGDGEETRSTEQKRRGSLFNHTSVGTSTPATKRTTTAKAATNLGHAIRPILLRAVKLKAKTILQGTRGPSRRSREGGGREEVEEGELSEPSRRS
jgi:hypothetical protein